jgi:hypothetical protein
LFSSQPPTFAPPPLPPQIEPSPAVSPPPLDFFSAAPPLISSPSQSEKSIVELIPSSHDEPGEAQPLPAAQNSPFGQAAPSAVKVAAPLGYQKREGSESAAAAIPQDQSESIQVEGNAEGNGEFGPDASERVQPQRRSFSGHSASSATKPAPAKQAQADDDDESDEIPSKKAVVPGELVLFGKTLSQKQALLIACITCLVLFVGFQAFCSLGSALFNGLGERLGAPSVRVSGLWRFACQSRKAICRGAMLMHQRGSEIYGEGKDNAMGPFRFSGSLKGGGAIEFNLQYSRGGQDMGKPVAFHGDLDTTSNPLFAKGDFQTAFRQGYGWRAQIVSITGVWEAELIRPMVEGQGQAGPHGGRINAPEQGGTTPFATKCLMVAGGLLGAVVGIWLLFIWLFGPDGWRAQKDKAKYIPSQFRKDHNKELKDLAQPVRPGSLPLGRRREWKLWTFWEKKDLALPPDVRNSNPHVLFLGGGQKGKTRLMAKMAAHDIESGDRALVIVDSDGSLSKLVTHWISAHPKGKEFTKRVLLVDPTYRGGSLTYNPVTMPEDGDLSNAAAAVEYGFKAIYTEPPGSQSQWTPQTAQILRSAALLLMITNRTLADLPNLLQDNDFRDILLEEAERKGKEKPELRPLLDPWGNYKKMARTEQWINWVEPILNRVQKTLSDPRVRPILTGQENGIDLRQVITDKKILIVNIPKGELHENAYLLGSLIVTGLKQAALSVAVNGKASERPVSLYLDEFDHFIDKETFNAITSETKVFQIGLLASTKTLQDFPEDFRNQLVAHRFGTMAIFALAKKDGDMLGPQMFRVDGRKRKHETLTNFVNPINTSPQFEFVSDEEKLNIDKVLGQPERVFFCYRVGSVAGLFHMKSHPFNDVPAKDIKSKLIEKMRNLNSFPDGNSAKGGQFNG